MAIKHIIFDFDGVFTLDDHSPVVDAFKKSSGYSKEQILLLCGEHERKWANHPGKIPCGIDDSTDFSGSN